MSDLTLSDGVSQNADGGQNSESLRPCPFCGDEIEMVSKTTVCCANVDCPAWMTSWTIEQWQSRPLEDALRAELAMAEKQMMIARKFIIAIKEDAITRTYENMAESTLATLDALKR